MTRQTLAEQFVSFLKEVGFKRISVGERLGMRIFRVDLSSLRLRFSHNWPLIEVSEEQVAERSAEEIAHSLTDVVRRLPVQGRMPIVLVDGQREELRPLVNQPPYRMIVLYADDMEQIVASTAPSQELLARVRFQIPLALLNPYEISAPVVGSGFFGRRREKGQILRDRDTCYSIVAAPRMGKTSLLLEAKRKATEADPEADSRLFYIDAMPMHSADDFFDRAISTLHPREYQRWWREGTYQPGYFPRFMERMKAKLGGPIVFFVDEFDYVLRFDREENYALIKTLRACFQEGSCRFVLAGSTEIRRELSTRGSPFSFTTRIPLANLHPDDVFEMVSVPMDSMGIRFPHRAIAIERIIDETGGHPNLVQAYCRALVLQMDRTGDREITTKMLSDAARDQEFRARILDPFIFNTDDVVKVVAYAAASVEGDRFSIDAVDRELKRNRLRLDISQIEDACMTLEELGVIEEVGPAYRFAIPLFASLLQSRYPSEFVFDKASESLVAGATEDEA